MALCLTCIEVVTGWSFLPTIPPLGSLCSNGHWILSFNIPHHLGPSISPLKVGHSSNGLSRNNSRLKWSLSWTTPFSVSCLGVSNYHPLQLHLFLAVSLLIVCSFVLASCDKSSAVESCLPPAVHICMLYCLLGGFPILSVCSIYITTLFALIGTFQNLKGNQDVVKSLTYV